MTVFRKLAAVIGVLIFATVAACSPTQEITVNPDAIIIDVRTPEEYAEGYLEGAQLLDILSGEFQAALPSLDPAAEYLVYCRSGNRSGQAVSIMEQAGFTNVINLGSVSEAAQATGIEIVR